MQSIAGIFLLLDLQTAPNPTLLQVLLLGFIQGLAELLPISSSAHVIVAEKLLRLDPSSPEMTFVLVMLHTGTMFAVIAYFWRAWCERFFATRERFIAVGMKIIVASFCTGVIGYGLKIGLERFVLGGGDKAEIEQLFSSLPVIAAALLVVGALILIAGQRTADIGRDELTPREAAWIGAVQGVALPFRGFSRSGGTISTAMLLGIGRRNAEEFSFALAVVLTPPVIARELLRLLKAHTEVASPAHLVHLLAPGCAGMICSFVAGLLALRWLSRWLETGHWSRFGWYCLAASTATFVLAWQGF